MGRVYRPGSLEAGQLKLSPEHLPCPASLLGDIQRRYVQGSAIMVGTISDNRELLESLRARQFFRLEPAAAVIALDEESGKWPAMTARQSALLKWLLQSFAYWEVSYPLEFDLSERFRSLLPLLAQTALSDESFTRPGMHPVHQVLDTLQLEAVGWQPGQGRAGDTLHRNLQAAIDSLRKALESRDREPAETLAARVLQSADAEQRRGARMVQRLVEVEQGQMKQAAARSQAAAMINQTLSRHSMPAQVGRFIKGPWYDSSQLVLLKFGDTSEEWQQLCEITERLAESMQAIDLGNEDESYRQQIMTRIKRLPGDLRRYLFSLQHDEDAANEAIGLIEFSHLRLLRHQPLQLYPVEPLPVAEEDEESRHTPPAVERIETGQWFLIQRDEPRRQARVQLAGKLDERRELLFNNRAGMKAFSMSYAEFDRALAQKGVRELNSGGSFSLCLLRAAGVTTTEQLDTLNASHQDDTGPGASASDTPPPVPDLREPDTAATRPPEAGIPEAGGDAPADTLEPEPLGLAAGTWLGFHDCDPPLLAKLAAHDREQGQYIFVNRRGVKLRQLSNAELLALAEQDLVDIFESQGSFRDHVNRLKTDPPGNAGHNKT